MKACIWHKETGEQKQYPVMSQRKGENLKYLLPLDFAVVNLLYLSFKENPSYCSALGIRPTDCS